MEIRTTRFGPVRCRPDDVLLFEEGILGLAECRQWVLLADVHNDAVAWLQSVDCPEVALAVVSPRRFVPWFQMRVARRELEPLELDEIGAARVLVIVSKTGRSVTLNLKAPLVLNLQRRLGRQVVTNGELPVQYEVTGTTTPLKKSA
ncbi:MAG: flagellar assembly protein FliW [Rhodopirellula sp.]|nr:flagellar assembly protein FliW [Rhodopirellula sp.]